MEGGAARVCLLEAGEASAAVEGWEDGTGEESGDGGDAGAVDAAGEGVVWKGMLG